MIDILKSRRRFYRTIERIIQTKIDYLDWEIGEIKVHPSAYKDSEYLDLVIEQTKINCGNSIPKKSPKSLRNIFDEYKIKVRELENEIRNFNPSFEGFLSS